MFRRSYPLALGPGLLALALLGPPLAANAAPSAFFEVGQLTPYPGGPLGDQARRALQAGREAEAVKLLRRLLARHATPDQVQARFLLARALHSGGDHLAAAAIFRRLVKSYPLLADYHRYYGARALYRARRFAAARALAAKVPRRSALALAAELLQADAYRALGKLAQGAAIWRRYLRRHPRGGRARRAHLQVAEAALKRAAAARGADRRAALREALTHLKQIVVRAPLWRGVARVKRRLLRVARQLPRGARLARLSGPELYRQARAFYRKMRNVKAERGFGAALTRGGLSAKMRCRARYYRAKSVVKQRRRARSAPLFARAVTSCRRAKMRLLVLKSLFNRARALHSKGDHRGAMRLFAAIEREFPRHSYADDARLRAAEAAVAMRDRRRARQLLRSLPRRYPRGDQAREALWRLAREAYFAGALPRALGLLERIVKRLGHASRYYAEGRALYWKARILARQGKVAAARATYARCAREYPLSYYALASFNRLRESAPADFRRLRKRLIAPTGKNAGRWRFPQTALTRRPAFRRGVELARLGLGAAAGRELARAGLGIRRGTPRDRLWLAAALYHRAGLWHISHQVPRSRDKRYKRSYPLGHNYRRWAISYPRAFSRAVRAESRRSGVPAVLVWAIMREESGFSTRIESYANAIGLMQLLLPTARSAASKHRIRVDRQALHDPAINIKLGATFLGWLHRWFKNVPLVIAGYNAGHGAVGKWLRRWRGAALDEFLERIPYDQTRRYTKRVLASLFAFSVLYDRQRVPRIVQKLPPPRRRRRPARGRR